jgi:hypothetical protein
VKQKLLELERNSSLLKSDEGGRNQVSDTVSRWSPFTFAQRVREVPGSFAKSESRLCHGLSSEVTLRSNFQAVLKDLDSQSTVSATREFAQWFCASAFVRPPICLDSDACRSPVYVSHGSIAPPPTAVHPMVLFDFWKPALEAFSIERRSASQ